MHNLHRATAALVFASLGCAAFAQGNPASSTFDKIKATGTVTLGVREASAPMAYALGANTQYVGYHVELCELVLKQIAPDAKREYMVLTAQNTMSLVGNGTVDIGCGPTTNNLTRQQQVAFALTSYVSQVRMAVKADSGITSFEQLAGRSAHVVADVAPGNGVDRRPADLHRNAEDLPCVVQIFGLFEIPRKRYGDMYLCHARLDAIGDIFDCRWAEERQRIRRGSVRFSWKDASNLL